MAEVRNVSILGLLRSPEDEWGWWYIFFTPEDVRCLQAGEIYFGWRPRPALRLADAQGWLRVEVDHGPVWPVGVLQG
ncbi:MAG: hypothetical protein K6V36_07345, partial [Anaerolineae bacterium]|nr:hypothetical protein [Anaerolineae bacterium]